MYLRITILIFIEIRISIHLLVRHLQLLSHDHDTDYHHDRKLHSVNPRSVAFRAIAAPTSLLFSALFTFCAAISLSLDDAEASVLPLVIIDQLSIDICIASENRQTWLLRCNTRYFLADTVADLLPSD